MLTSLPYAVFYIDVGNVEGKQMPAELCSCASELESQVLHDNLTMNDSFDRLVCCLRFILLSDVLYTKYWCATKICAMF